MKQKQRHQQQNTNKMLIERVIDTTNALIERKRLLTF